MASHPPRGFEPLFEESDTDYWQLVHKLETLDVQISALQDQRRQLLQQFEAMEA